MVEPFASRLDTRAADFPLTLSPEFLESEPDERDGVEAALNHALPPWPVVNHPPSLSTLDDLFETIYADYTKIFPLLNPYADKDNWVCPPLDSFVRESYMVLVRCPARLWRFWTLTRCCRYISGALCALVTASSCLVFVLPS
jgi:hypothetical protein